ncbi:hypothetical protein [Microbulbifer sp. GL-2]|uniref:hypothetical protein n=1 Tax=Microbulbifer sp. GL-2 TaxID=2591606 RepID=UPI001165B730|nr:hypothetical protein [Microbulbifer sp. GL-2]BBM02429.1 hypothetical protein GL2_25030 [Microbulbifer sp. GL-2]
MPRSIWKLHLDSSSEDSARKIVNRCIKAFGCPPSESTIEKYSKGGYMATLDLLHNDKYSWSEVVVEVIEFGQRLGGGWSMLGNISSESNAVLSKSVGNHIGISGLQWAEWLVLNEHQA